MKISSFFEFRKTRFSTLSLQFSLNFTPVIVLHCSKQFLKVNRTYYKTDQKYFQISRQLCLFQDLRIIVFSHRTPFIFSNSINDEERDGFFFVVVVLLLCLGSLW